MLDERACEQPIRPQDHKCQRVSCLADEVAPVRCVLSRWGRHGLRVGVPLSHVPDGSGAAFHGRMYRGDVACISTIERMPAPPVVRHGLGAIDNLNVRPAQTADEYPPSLRGTRLDLRPS